MAGFDIKAWRKVRPAAAKDQGVADAIKKIDTAFKKKPADMSEKEVDAASAALSSLKSALEKARKEVSEDGKGKDRKDFEKIVSDWTTDIQKQEKELQERKSYDIKLSKAQKLMEDKQDEMGDQIKSALEKAKAWEKKGEIPSDKEVMDLMTVVRDGSKFFSKQGVSALGGDGKLVNPVDLVSSPTAKAAKSQVAELAQICDGFIKAKKTAARGGAAAGGNGEADKALKDVAEKYKANGKDLKTLANAAKKVADEAKELAEAVKKAVEGGAIDGNDAKALGQRYKKLALLGPKLDEEIRKTGSSWRESGGAISKLSNDIKNKSDYDDKTHGKLVKDLLQAQMLVLRQATVPLAECQRQIERVRNHMQESNSLRGYA